MIFGHLGLWYVISNSHVDRGMRDIPINLKVATNSQENILSVFYQYSARRRTETLKFFNNVSQNDFDVIILSETWLYSKY